jgi:hypothetical protein
MLPGIQSKVARVVILGLALSFLLAVLVVQTRDAVPVIAEASAEVLATVPETYAPETVPFDVRVDGDPVPYRVQGLFVLPGEEVVFQAPAEEGRRIELQAESGQSEATAAGQWQWTPPDTPGVYAITVWDELTGEAVRINAFVMVPFAHTEQRIGAFQVGRYQEEPLQGNPAYERPQGFIEVTEENQDALVSPHFTVGQFVSKQTADFPKYVALQEKLLLKLEVILQAVNERGIPANTFHVMSAFRTPFYNASIGNETEYSMHLYGGAADIFVDMDGDGNMDDLNNDGQVTRADAEYMAEIVEELRRNPDLAHLEGGLGIYNANPSHGPFIHVDVRGQAVNW